MRVAIESRTTLAMASMSSEVNGPRTQRARVTLAWKAIGLFPRLFALIAVPLLFENLESFHFFGGHVRPGNAEMVGVKFQLQQPLEQAARMRVVARIVEIIQLAMAAANDRTQSTAAVWTLARHIGVVDCPHTPTFAAADIVGVGAATRTIDATITQFFGMNRAVNQQPERDGARPLVRC